MKTNDSINSNKMQSYLYAILLINYLTEKKTTIIFIYRCSISTVVCNIHN